MNQQTTLKKFYRSLNKYVPGGIVEATGMARSNPRSGWEAIEVRYPFNGVFKYDWMQLGDLVACPPPANWLEDDGGKPLNHDLLALMQDYQALTREVNPLPFDDINAVDVLHRIIGDLKLLEGLSLRGLDQLALLDSLADVIVANPLLIIPLRVKINLKGEG